VLSPDADHAKGIRQVIVNADDFGLHPAVNQAVEMAHRDGILTSASLMVAAPAAADAVALAKRLPSLAVGLHIVLVDGKAMLPAEKIPALVDRSGRFTGAMAVEGVRFFLLPRVRRQLIAEIEAQFEAFAATGLPLDHVNAHKHFHLHPTLFSMILDTGKRFGLKSMRLPRDPVMGLGLKPWMALMRKRMDRAGVFHNDAMLGLSQSGHFDEPAVLDAIASMPEGVTEMYFHPATLSGSAIAPSMPDYRHSAELQALLSPRVRQALEQKHAVRTTFGALAAA
jgi:hopanoid biosynthesis associated protein HpnK